MFNTVNTTLMFVYFQTLLNKQPNPLYLASIIPGYCVLLISGVLAFFVAGGSLANIRAAFVCRKGRYEID